MIHVDLIFEIAFFGAMLGALVVYLLFLLRGMA